MNSNYQLGKVYLDCINDQEAALDNFNDCFNTAKDLCDSSFTIKSAVIISNIYLHLEKFDKAVDVLNMALKFQPKVGEQSTIWANLGVVYKSVSDFPKALECYTKSFNFLEQSIALEQIQDINDSLQIAGLLILIGEIHSEMNTYQSAHKYYDSAMKLGEGNPLILTGGFMGHGLSYKNEHKLDLAILSYGKALEIVQQNNDTNNEVGILRELSEIYLSKNELPRALELAHQSRNIAIASADSIQLQSIYITLGKIHNSQKDYIQAEKYVKEAISLSAAIKKNVNKDAWLTLSSIYENMNRPTEALDAYKKYVAARDEELNTNKANELTRIDLEANYNRRLYADSLASAKKDKLAEGKYQRQKAYTTLGIVLVVVLIAFSIIVVRNNRTQKELNSTIKKLVEEQEVTIMHRTEQLETSNEKLANSNKKLVELIQYNSHNLREPLTRITGAMSIREYTTPEEFDNEIWPQMARAADQLDKTIKQVVAMADETIQKYGK